MTETVRVLDGPTPIPVIEMVVPDFVEVFASLGRVQRRFPARTLRRLKEHVHELVLTTDPRSRLYAEPLELDDSLSNVDVVLGVGIQDRLLSHVGYRGLTRMDLLEDVLADDSAYPDPESIVRETLPALLHGRARAPVFRYLREAGLLTNRGALRSGVTVPEGVQHRIDVGQADYGPSESVSRRAHQIADAARHDMKTLLDGWNLSDVSCALGLLRPGSLDLALLRSYLLETDSHDSWWTKLVCYYDYLKFGNLEPQQRRHRRFEVRTAREP